MPPPSRGRGLYNHWLWWLLLIQFITLTASTEDWSTGCQAINCNCRWVHGKKTADCERISAIPDQLSPEIQVLNISFNELTYIPKNAFRDVGLVNLHKLFMKGCNIETIDPGAFNGLEIVIEIDLTHNNIRKLDSRTFQENYRLRLLYLNNNPIEKLEDGLFSNHTFLQTVELNNNRIQHIGPKTFVNTPQLQRLSFEGNRLSFLRLTTVSQMTKLKSLVLANNPWKCDCKLRPLRDWVEERKLNAQPTKCIEPDRLKDKFWSEIRSEEFACRPHLVLPSSSVAASTGGNVTISCRASGDPAPTINWVLNSLVLGNNSRPSHSGYHQHYALHRGESRSHIGEYWTWANLTIINVKLYDSGKYACVATNPGGVAEENLSLGVRDGGGGIIASAAAGDLYVWLVSLLVAALVLLIFVLVLCWCLCRRKSRRNHHRNQILKKHDQINSNGDLINGEDEQEKALITKINPLQKPPRRIESAQSSMNGSQTTDLNRSHLMIEDGMATGNGGTMRTRTTEGGDDPLMHQSYDSLLDADEFTISKRYEMPTEPIRGRPDLLAFPRAGQDSPAGSSTSTAPDRSRLPLQPHSPGLILQAPPHLSGFGTLPYARSQSPFSPGIHPIMGSCGSLPVVTNRQGYVTIPRRPRAPSWAAPPRVGDPLLKMEPIYDNLGRRTTVDGSSTLSLNSNANSTLTRSPNRTQIRPLPVTPLPYLTSPLPKYYAPIEEVEPQPSPAPIRHKMSSPEPLKELRMSPDGDDKRSSIAASTNGMEETPLIDNSSPDQEPTLKGPKKKVPPKVPPKPAKRKLPQAASNEPLYEDAEEGEDGTEV